MNNKMKLLKILLELYKEEYNLNLKEGLIKTTNIDKTLNILKKQFGDNFKFYKDNNSFIASSKETKSEEAKTEVDGLLKLTNNLGWFPSWIHSGMYHGKWNKKAIGGSNYFEITFEAKYDEEIVENIPEYVYHVTPSQNVEKILKFGLVPKSRSKASYHPERVYLLTKIGLGTARDLAEMFAQKTGILNWSLLKIDTSLIPGDYIRLYKDPNFSKGSYTLNNIPPQAIEKIEDIKL